MPITKFRVVLLLLLGLGANPASARPPADAPGHLPATASPQAALRAGGVCAGIRGNGPRLWAHLTSLARIVEEFGPIAATAGGSSGSISIFLTESIHANPLVSRCGGRKCSRLESGARIALLLKSLQGIQDAGLIDDFRTLAGIIAIVQEQGIEALLQTDPQAGVQALLDILSDPLLQQIINPELFELLLNSPDPVFHATDIVESLASAASFEVNDATVFVRPGLINFEAFAGLVDRLGSFYVGYAPFDYAGAERFLDACAVPGLGNDWPDIKDLPAGASTCGEAFTDLFEDFRAQRSDSDRSRLDDRIGRYMPALVTTSVLQGDAVPEFETALADYFAAQPVMLNVDFDDVRFGYWGRKKDLRRVERRLRRNFFDAKSAKFTDLGERPWREILTRSPAEPGLSRAVSLPDGRVSAGGWTDPVPAQVLRSLGCETTVLVNRRDGIGGFTTGVAAQLGATQEDLDALYDLADPNSGFTTALSDADGVWCTNWDAPDTFDITALSAEGYNAPLETFDPDLLGYENAFSYLGIVGCTPLVTE
ncbi:MAG: hypothetical protein KJO38_11830 [Gammaproteobacteria bacterium]|nr:hypothetical protein [Gammaproteobacteria bacterium]